MADEDETKGPSLLTTREVADLLRVKERKVYELAAAGAIPHRRLTGKLLFPSREIASWIDGVGAAGSSATIRRPPVVAGSHDPLLEWALRESKCGLAALTDGSADGLERFLRGEAAVAAMHMPEDGGWNVKTVAAHAPTDVVLIAFAVRTQGLMVSDGAAASIATLGDLAGRRVILRQPGSGARALFDRLCEAAGVRAQLIPHGTLARTESEAAVAVHAGEADAALGLKAVAQQFRLSFVPLVQERFDLLIDRHAYFTEPLQALLGFCRTPDFARKAEAMGGYDLGEFAKVRWLSP